MIIRKYMKKDVEDMIRIWNAVKNILEQNMVDGVLKIPKEYGMFICRQLPV